MSGVDNFFKYERWYLASGVFTFLFIETSINATSIVMEGSRSGSNVPAWVPFVQEYSSGVAIALLIPLVLKFVDRFPLNWPLFKRNAWFHIVGSLVFSVLHILLMVGMRWLIFGVTDMVYRLGNLQWEFLYEYRKDAWTYVAIVASIYGYRFITGRLRGEASMIAEGETPDEEEVPDRLLVKKLGKEFIVRVDDIEWLESSGNYVNLHINKRIYPLRTTLSSLIEQLEPRGFRRIHRSHAVKLDCVASINPLESGDATITLRNGLSLNMSRRYRNEFRQHMEL